MCLKSIYLCVLCVCVSLKESYIHECNAIIHTDSLTLATPCKIVIIILKNRNERNQKILETLKFKF